VLISISLNFTVLFIRTDTTIAFGNYKFQHLLLSSGDLQLFFIHANFVKRKLECKSRDSVVGITTCQRLDDREVGVQVPVGVKNFHFSKSSRPALGSTQPPIQWVPGVKRPRREADHSPPTSAQVKKMWIYTSAPHTPSRRSA
jgi:hypothetical protein